MAPSCIAYPRFDLEEARWHHVVLEVSNEDAWGRSLVQVKVACSCFLQPGYPVPVGHSVHQFRVSLAHDQRHYLLHPCCPWKHHAGCYCGVCGAVVYFLLQSSYLIHALICCQLVVTVYRSSSVISATCMIGMVVDKWNTHRSIQTLLYSPESMKVNKSK